MKTAGLIVLCTTALAGCLNMPTPVNQITPTYVSTLNYEAFDCNKLTVEMDALSRREGVLVAAQTQRIKTSEAQAFWNGYGQGDGVEATELARVRGEREAVMKAIATKSCAAK
jgi:outer membrane murein-binding lipoprotein Lpp